MAPASTVVRGVIWAGTSNGLIKVTKNEGQTWADATIPNLIVTPHVAWASREAIQGLADQLLHGLLHLAVLQVDLVQHLAQMRRRAVHRQAIVQDDVGLVERAQRVQREQARVAGTRADEINHARPSAHALPFPASV